MAFDCACFFVLILNNFEIGILENEMMSIIVLIAMMMAIIVLALTDHS